MKTKNEAKAVLSILKSPEKEYNANNLSKIIAITPMGALKILKKLEKEDVLVSSKIANASYYRVNFSSSYASDYAAFLLKDEAEHSPSYAKRWISELRKIKEADIAIIFGSAIKSEEKAKDIDALFVVAGRKFDALKEEIKKLNLLNEKKIHPIFQTKKDLLRNIGKKDPVVLSAIKGVAAFGEREFVDLLGSAK